MLEEFVASEDLVDTQDIENSITSSIADHLNNQSKLEPSLRLHDSSTYTTDISSVAYDLAEDISTNFCLESDINNFLTKDNVISNEIEESSSPTIVLTESIAQTSNSESTLKIVSNSQEIDIDPTVLTIQSTIPPTHPSSDVYNSNSCSHNNLEIVSSETSFTTSTNSMEESLLPPPIPTVPPPQMYYT